MICGIIILTYIIYRTIEMLPASFGTQMAMIDLIRNRDDSFDLMKHNFYFGIEEIDPTIGRIEVYATTWAPDG